LYLLGYRTAYLDEAAEDWSPCRIIDVVGLDVAFAALEVDWFSRESIVF
jgi:hypothetical protein